MTIVNDYNIVKDMKKFPRSLASGLQKMIPGVKLSNYKIRKTRGAGMGITFPGDSAPKLMIEYRERMFDPEVERLVQTQNSQNLALIQKLIVSLR